VAGDPSNTQDAGTLRLINIGSDIALLLAFALSFLTWLVIPYPRISLNLGTALLALGSLLRRYCFWILGKYFTAAVTVSPDQPVIDKGPYRWIRHPGYAAGFLSDSYPSFSNRFQSMPVESDAGVILRVWSIKISHMVMP
jgi:hypothetical protein